MITNTNSGSTEGDTTLIHPDCARRTKRYRPVSLLVDEQISHEIRNKDDRGFLLDIIVIRLDIPNKSIDESSKLTVEADFNGKSLFITSSRINILDFKSERSFEFIANPVELKEQLSKNPLTLKVTDKADVIGYGRLEWSKEFLSGVEECEGEMINSFETELKKCNGTKAGAMQILMRLQPKCKEYEEDTSPDGKCRNANKEVDPNDVLFVVGEEKKVCCCSQIGIIPATESEQDLQPNCLDLSNYRAVNSQNVNNTDILAPVDPACENLKAITNHYQKLINAINTKKKENSDTTNKKKSNIFYTLPSDSCSKMNVIPSSLDCYRMPTLSPSDNRAFSAKNVQVTHIEKPPELIENVPQSVKCCPVCKENMDYLPKLAACPICCYKPIPYFLEKPYDDSQYADQILKDFHDKLQRDDNSGSATSLKESPKSRCTCEKSSKKPCAHCRIRKLCGDMFQSPLQTSKSDDVCDKKISDVYCASSSDNRAFLTRIFSELKDIYGIEDPKQKPFQIDERCEKLLNKSSVATKHFPQQNEVKEKIQTDQTDKASEISKPKKTKKPRKRSLKPASQLAVRSKLYDYEFVRRSCSSRFGHKTCVNGYAGRKNVPPNMGWLWNVNNYGKWKPGAIRKPIKELMRYFLKDFPADTLLVSQYCCRKISRARNIGDPSLQDLVQKPTLHIQKKDGEYVITMRPLKPLEVLKDCADPYENMKPLQFRIIKNPQLEMIRHLKKSLKSQGFKKCTCHRPIIFCYCRNFMEKKRLEYQCNKECCRRQLTPCCDTLVLSDTSDSEEEFDFSVTPPVGVIKPEKLKNINFVNVATQYSELDWNPQPLFSRPPNKYMQMYQCALGERKVNDIANGNAEDRGGEMALRPNEAGRYARPKGMVMGRGFARTRGAGDGFLMTKGTAKRTAKGGAIPIDFSGKYGGHPSPAYNKKVENVPKDRPKKKFDMIKYIVQRKKKVGKETPADAAAKRKNKMNLLRGVNPPLLCMVDRLGKPIDPCAPCFPCGDYRVC